MAATKEQITRAIELAREAGDDVAIAKLEAMLGGTSGASPPVSPAAEPVASGSGVSNTGGAPVAAPINLGSGGNIEGAQRIQPAGQAPVASPATTSPSAPALATPNTQEPAGALQTEPPKAKSTDWYAAPDRTSQLNARAYEADQAWKQDPASKPSPEVLSAFLEKNTNPALESADKLKGDVVIDKKTGKPRWAALSPEQIAKAEAQKQAKKDKTRGALEGQAVQAVGALSSGTLNTIVAPLITNVDTEIEQGNAFQRELVTRFIPPAEKERIMELATEKYGKNHRYVKDPGLMPANVLKEFMDMNPDNEKLLEQMSGDEWWEGRKEFAGRLGSKVLTSLRNAVPFMGSDEPVNPFGMADDPSGALTGRQGYEGIDYTGDNAPKYTGASQDIQNWRNEAGRQQGIYEGIIKPWLTTKEGVMPGEQVTQLANDIVEKTYTETGKASREKNFFNPDIEIKNFGDLLQKDVWLNEKSKFPWNDFEGFMIMLMENTPQIALSIAVTRGAGAAGAREGWTVGRGLTLAQQEANRVAMAGRYGLVAGTQTEGLLTSTAVEQQTRQSLNEVPMEKFREDPLFANMVEGGLTEETAKQILVNDAANVAAVTSYFTTVAVSGPMTHLIGKSAAGRLARDQGTKSRWALGTFGEMAQEGSQGLGEQLAQEMATKKIDPDNPIFSQPNRYLEAFVGEAIVAAPFGAISVMQPNKPPGVPQADLEVAQATTNYMTATNDRFKFQTKISDPEHIANTTPNERLSEMQQLENLQKLEAKALLDAEPKMRAHLESQGTEVSKTELKMLGALKMRANAMLHDIAVAKSRRRTAADIQAEEQAVITARNDLQQRVNDDVLKLEDMNRMADAIESVQDLGAIGYAEEAELIKEGYAKRTEEGKVVILPKGKRAVKELRRQARGLQGRLENGYLGPERRSPENLVKRTRLEDASPQEREAILYEDTLTNAKNRRAFNERQENIDYKGEGVAPPVEGAKPVVAAVDIDSLKWVNDNMDHSAGDRLVMAVSDAISQQEGVDLYRTGGDEFTVTGESNEAVEEALQKAKAILDGQEIVSGKSAVTPQISWGKGTTYAEADTAAIAAKEARVASGKVAKRGEKPSTWKSKDQLPLFQLDKDGNVAQLITSWNKASSFAQRGDSVEILSPTGAHIGVVTNVTNRRGRPRMKVNISGRNFTFNPLNNHLITQSADPADVAWLTGDEEFADPDRASMPQFLDDVNIGHLGTGGVWYADLSALEKEMTSQVSPPWWVDTYPDMRYSNKTFMAPRLPEATQEQMDIANAVKQELVSKYNNLPPINVVRSIDELNAVAPEVVAQIRSELGGGSINGVRGYMDHINPNNGIYIMVPNIYAASTDQTLEQAIAETVLHELIGHYGVRGVFRDEAQLRPFMHDIVDSFPRLAKVYANRLGLSAEDADQKQLLGEEMVAYLAGEVMSGTVKMTPRQKTLWQKFLSMIRSALHKMGLNQWSPLKKFDAVLDGKINDLRDTKIEFWNDDRIVELLSRAQDFVGKGPKFEWVSRYGQAKQFMRDGEIFQAGILTALNTAMVPIPSNERKQKAKQLGVPVSEVPKERPLFSEIASVKNFQQAIKRAISDGLMTQREAELSGLDESSEFYLFRDATYGTLQKYISYKAGGEPIAERWYQGILPANLVQELDEINDAMERDYIAGPLRPVGTETDRETGGQLYKFPRRPVTNETSAEFKRKRIAEILEMPIDPNKTQITKSILEAHMRSENVFRVYVEPANHYPELTRAMAARRLFGSEIDWSDLTEEQRMMVADEMSATERYGYDIGYSPELKRWFDWSKHTTQFARLSPQGSRYNDDYRVALIKTSGRGGEMATNVDTHYAANLIHIRTGVAKLLNYEGMPELEFMNPELEGLMLSLIELQSDWLQKLRKAFSSDVAKQAASAKYHQLAKALSQVSGNFALGVSSDITMAINNDLDQIINLSDGETGDAPAGAISSKVDSLSQMMYQRPWSNLSAPEKKNVWAQVTKTAIEDVARKYRAMSDYLIEQKQTFPKLDQLAGTMDARAFERLDYMQASAFLESVQGHVSRLSQRLLDNLAFSDNQAEMLELAQSIVRRVSSGLTEAASHEMHNRIPMTRYILEPILARAYEIGGLNSNNLPNRLEGITTRDQATVRIPIQTIVDANNAFLGSYDAVSLVDEMLSPSRISRHSDFPPGAISLIANTAGDNFIDVSIIGTKADIQKAESLVPNLIDTWINDHAQEKREINKRYLEESEKLSTRNRYSYRELDEELNFQEADVEEGDELTRANGITTFYSYEEDNFGEIFDEIIMSARNNIEWDNVEWEGVTRTSEEYRDRLIVDDDGDVDNSDAEVYLEEQRQEYIDSLNEDEDLRTEAYDQLREQWNEQGNPAYVTAQLPTNWDEAGDPSDWVTIEIRAADPGDAYDIIIDGEEVDYEGDLDTAKDSLSNLIRDYYSDNNIRPPVGKLFAPEASEAAPEKEDVKPNWEMVKSNIISNLAMMSDNQIDLVKAYEEYVMLKKKLEDHRMYLDSPLSSDSQWRPIALRYLIADAVRRGLGGIMWNNGLSSSTRGQMGFSGVESTDAISWSKQKIQMRGGEHEVYVIQWAESGRSVVVSQSSMIPILGRDVAQAINNQERGKLKQPSINKKQDFVGPPNARSNYIVSASEDGSVFSVHRRINNSFVGFGRTEQETDLIIAKDFQKNGGLISESQNEPVAALPPRENLGEVLSSGAITSEMVGSKIHIIMGSRQGRYSDTFETPRLAGARKSYEDITLKGWEKELKKYGVKIGTTYVQANDMQKAITEEGQATRRSNTADEKIAEEHGRIWVAEMQGGVHGFIVMSEKQGPLYQRVFDNKADAQLYIDQYVKDSYGEGREGVKVFYIPINEKMREAFSGPVAPFHYDPRKDPILKGAAKKIGYTPTPLRERYKQFKTLFMLELQQGALDRFYGLRRALNQAGVDDGSYISARLSTSLDSLMKGVLEYGHPVWEDGIVSNQGRGLLEIFQPILNDPGTWGMYMVGKRSKRLMLEGYDKLSPEDKKLIDKAASHFNGDIFAMMVFAVEYDPSLERDAGTTKGRKKTILDTEKLRELMLHLDHLKEAREGRYYNRNGRRVPREWLEEEAKDLTNKLVGISKRASPPTEEFIETVRKHLSYVQAMLNPTDLEITRIEDQIKQIEREISPHKKNQKRWAKRDDTMAALHSIDNLVQGGREHHFNIVELDRMVKLGDAFPAFERVAQEYSEFNKKMLDFGEASGIIDPEGRAMWEHGDYIPFYRVDDDRLHASGLSPTSGIANQRSPIKRLRGGKQNIGDVMTNILMNVTKIMDASVKNNAALEAVDALRGSGIISRQPMQWSQELIPMKQLEKVLRDKGVIVDDSEEGIHMGDLPDDALSGMQKLFAIKAPQGPGIISVMRNGKREYYHTDDMLLYRSLASMNKQSFGLWMEAFRFPKRALTNLITVDPGFIIANFLRDTGSAFVLSRDASLPVISAAKGFYSALVEDEVMRTLVGSGAAFENGYITGADPKNTSRILKRAMKKKSFARTVLTTPIQLFRAWKHVSSSVENANRIAVYNAAIAAGKSKKQAAYEAKDLMDFSMQGDNALVQFLIQTVPFINARAQGNYRLARGLNENPKAFVMKGAMVALAGMALFLRFKDDERYKELEDWDKFSYFHWWTGDNHYRLPMPFEVGAIFNTLPQLLVTRMLSDEGDANEELARGIGFMLSQTFSMNPIPQTVMPMFEMAYNHNFFTGRPIVSYYEAGRKPTEQYRYRTSPTMIEMANKMPEWVDTPSNGKLRSPLHLENMYRAYTGTIGKYILQASDEIVRRSLDYPLPPALETRDIPAYGRFVRGNNPERSTKYQTEVYRLLDKVNATKNSLSFFKSTGQKEDYQRLIKEDEQYIKIAKPLEKYREAIQDINRGIQRIYMDSRVDENGNVVMTREEKQKRIDILERKRNELFRRAYDLRPGASPDMGEPVTDADVINVIDEFGVDNSQASIMFLQDRAPDTYKLLELITQDMAAGNLRSIAKAGGMQ